MLFDLPRFRLEDERPLLFLAFEAEPRFIAFVPPRPDDLLLREVDRLPLPGFPRPPPELFRPRADFARLATFLPALPLRVADAREPARDLPLLDVPAVDERFPPPAFFRLDVAREDFPRDEPPRELLFVPPEPLVFDFPDRAERDDLPEEEDSELPDPPFELEPTRRPATAPRSPPTTVPTGPTMLPITAPVAAPAASFEMDGI